MTYFSKHLVEFANGRDLKDVAKTIKDNANQRVWGVFTGLFGVASNELVVMTVDDDVRPNTWPDGVSEVTREVLRATVRPTSTESLSRQGVYVFRSFELDGVHIERVVELSRLAWETFEVSDDYRAVPIGLFAPDAPSPRCTMYLLTWYDDLNSWQTSRAPHPDARAHFRERHALLRSSRAVATRLLI